MVDKITILIPQYPTKGDTKIYMGGLDNALRLKAGKNWNFEKLSDQFRASSYVSASNFFYYIRAKLSF